MHIYVLVCVCIIYMYVLCVQLWRVCVGSFCHWTIRVWWMLSHSQRFKQKPASWLLSVQLHPHCNTSVVLSLSAVGPEHSGGRRRPWLWGVWWCQPNWSCLQIWVDWAQMALNVFQPRSLVHFAGLAFPKHRLNAMVLQSMFWSWACNVDVALPGHVQGPFNIPGNPDLGFTSCELKFWSQISRD